MKQGQDKDLAANSERWSILLSGALSTDTHFIRFGIHFGVGPVLGGHAIAGGEQRVPVHGLAASSLVQILDKRPLTG